MRETGSYRVLHGRHVQNDEHGIERVYYPGDTFTGDPVHLDRDCEPGGKFKKLSGRPITQREAEQLLEQRFEEERVRTSNRQRGLTVDGDKKDSKGRDPLSYNENVPGAMPAPAAHQQQLATVNPGDREPSAPVGEQAEPDRFPDALPNPPSGVGPSSDKSTATPPAPTQAKPPPVTFGG